MNDADRAAQLFGLAQRSGIEAEYCDVKGETHRPSIDALLAVMGSLGHELGSLADVAAANLAFEEQRAETVAEPIVVAWSGQPCAFELRLPATSTLGQVDISIELETGTVVELGRFDAVAVRDEALGGRSLRIHRVELPPLAVPAGYHHVVVTAAAVGTLRRSLFPAPSSLPGFGPDERLWGVFAPVYSLSGGTGLGAHVGSLATLARSIDELGGKIVGTLPLLAAWLGEPFDPSPYAPVSRRFWNELFVDLAALPELVHAPGAAANLEGLRSIGHAANEKTRVFDYRHQYGFVRGVLEAVVDGFDAWPQGLRDDFSRWSAAGDVADYAVFRAYAEARGHGWHSWPEPQRAGRIEPRHVDPAVVRFHEFGQYAMQRDLEGLNRELTTTGRDLYLDLPIGAHSDGYDTWKHREVFAWGTSAGAPPDDFFADGQTWGFPPLSPTATRLDGHRHFRDVLRHHMQVTGILRLDHVMGLHRLFCVPDGMRATDGVYLRYPRDELLAVLAIEAHRHECIVIGEDLGTVPDEIRQAMDDHAVLGMYVAEFNQPSWPGAHPVVAGHDQLASVDTHDTPTFAGWVHALDIDRRHVLGMLSDADAERERADRRQQVQNLAWFLVARGEVPATYDTEGEPRELVLLDGLLRFLGDSPAPAVLVALDDLVGERNPQNVPGTLVDRPNWVQRFPIQIERLAVDEGVCARLRALQSCRLGSHLRTKAAP